MTDHTDNTKTEQDAQKGAEEKGRLRIIEEKFFGSKKPKFLKARRKARGAENKTLKSTATVAEKYAKWARERSDKTVEIRMAELDRMIAEHDLEEKQAREDKLKKKQKEQQTVVEFKKPDAPSDDGDAPAAA